MELRIHIIFSLLMKILFILLLILVIYWMINIIFFTIHDFQVEYDYLYELIP